MNKKRFERRRVMKTDYGRLKFNYSRIKTLNRLRGHALRKATKQLGRPLLYSEIKQACLSAWRTYHFGREPDPTPIWTFE